MKYVQFKENTVDLKETNENGDLIHEEIPKKIPNAAEIDTLLFNELMSMLNGGLAMTRYIAQNVIRSGLEIWRKLDKNNDPNTYNKKRHTVK